MLVDSEVLRAFATHVDTASAAIAGLDVGSNATTAADGLSGSTTQWTVRLIGAHLALQADAIATDVTTMGAAVRGAGDTYEVEDSALAGAFDGLF